MLLAKNIVRTSFTTASPLEPLLCRTPSQLYNERPLCECVCLACGCGAQPLQMRRRPRADRVCGQIRLRIANADTSKCMVYVCLCVCVEYPYASSSLSAIVCVCVCVYTLVCRSARCYTNVCWYVFVGYSCTDARTIGVSAVLSCCCCCRAVYCVLRSPFFGFRC